MTTARDLLEEAVARMEAAGVSFGHGTVNALDESVWLLLHTLGVPYAEMDEHIVVSAAKARTYRALVSKRIATRKPAAYLLNEAWLGPYKFYVDERAIVPRSFIAELLLREWGQDLFAKPGISDCLDLCTGSGCLAILLADKRPKVKVDAVDLSSDALEVAKRNVADYKLTKRIKLIRSNMFAALGDRTYDLIVSNPPYVKASSMRALPEEYRAEPAMALASGCDGLDHTRTILREVRRHLNPRGLLVVEMGHNKRALVKAFPKLPFQWPRTVGGTGKVFTLRREDLAH
ncbi:50S ribosomal protein L3 N(5)-glutamine methyltransferase [Usitatibacter palustris]|uniref:50S ribosomal protein L3 glutamine methyltransferase n=1 Tax=Usitatibacter palustris TaxID=2732487 RepID=A0A6M4H4B3_9PROT|nr:50S ribosomal protein L3 N(5)-glutamine methyltransferase [Usitatibacter palustris]QJR14122.1 50S ribosomal protein L3 glutamine methyltransferase [Usitatibacter palustris]